MTHAVHGAVDAATRHEGAADDLLSPSKRRRIDRAKPLDFTFDGKPMRGFAGDTLASALLANGRLLVGRSFKYHRPRGILTAGAAEPNALVTIGQGGRTEANTRATVPSSMTALTPGARTAGRRSTSTSAPLNGLLSPFLGAGFYYKTFMWPAAFWEKVYEPFIRKAAGLGRADLRGRPGRLREMLGALRPAGDRRRARPASLPR